MTDAKKVTKKEGLNVIKDIVNASEYDNKEGVIGFIDHELELLEKKSSAISKAKADKIAADDKIKENIIAVMLNNNPMMVTTITNAVNAKTGEVYSPQKISAMIQQLEKTGNVVKSFEKKRALYSVK